jgi:hypothetical protein
MSAAPSIVITSRPMPRTSFDPFDRPSDDRAEEDRINGAMVVYLYRYGLATGESHELALEVFRHQAFELLNITENSTAHAALGIAHMHFISPLDARVRALLSEAATR